MQSLEAEHAMPADTIFALATAALPSSRAILRLSGPEAIAIARKLTEEPLPRSAYTRGRYAIRISSSFGAIPAELWAMPAPASATGEDCAELHLPGNSYLIADLEEQLLGHGARRAEAGEFSKRAYLNGRMDLSQAEAVMALVSAADSDAVRRAQAVLEGRVAGELRGFVSQLESLCAAFEVSFDFDEEAAEQSDEERFLERAQELLGHLSSLSGKSPPITNQLPTVTLVGPANAGKSTIFNALLGKTRAAVADEAGTTRDAVTQETSLAGVPCQLVDTAGLKEAADRIEEQALAAANTKASSSDLLLLVIDGSASGVDQLAASLKDWVNADPAIPARALLLRTKLDLFPEPKALPVPLSQVPAIGLCAPRGDGIPELRAAVSDRLRQLLSPECVNVSARAHELMTYARDCLADAVEGLGSGAPLEAVSDLARQALASLREYLGDEPSPDVLDHIFSNFCIGK